MAITKTSLDMRHLCYSSQGDRCAYYSEAGGFRLDYDYESIVLAADSEAAY